MGESSNGGGGKNGILNELHLLRQRKASIQWVETKIEPIEKNISDLWREAEKARDHKCVRGDMLKRIMKDIEVIPTMRENISSWIIFKNVFIGAIGTLLVICAAAIVAFANVQADTENSKREIAKQAEQLDSVELEMKHMKGDTRTEEKTLIDMRRSLQKIEEAVLKKN